MNSPKFAFIGFGRHAQANLYPVLKHLDCQLSAVSTRHEESARKAASQYNIPATYSDHQTMLGQEKPDAVFIAASPNEQLAIVRDALESGAHVFIEKPLGMQVAQAKEIADKAETAKKQVMVGFMKRFAPAYLKAKELTLSKNFGQPLAVSQFFACRNCASNAHEYLLFAAIHYVDLLRFYYGDISEVFGAEISRNGSQMLSFTVCFKNGAIGSLQFGGSPSWERGTQEMLLTGDAGYVKVSGIDSVVALSRDIATNTPGWQATNYKEERFGTMLSTSTCGLQPQYLNGFVGELRHFIDAITTGQTVDNSAIDNLKTMEVVDQMVTSLRR